MARVLKNVEMAVRTLRHISLTIIAYLSILYEKGLFAQCSTVYVGLAQARPIYNNVNMLAYYYRLLKFGNKHLKHSLSITKLAYG